METEIGTYDRASRTVPVTFTVGTFAHSRDVNACHDEQGEYDEVATEARVEQVGRGVAVKIAVGAIVEAQPVDLPEPIEASTEEPAAE